MNTMKSEISVTFTLTGLNFKPDDITNKLGIIPTKTWLVGDLINPKTLLKRKENGWSLQSELELNNYELEDHLKNVLEKLHSQSNLLKELCLKNYGELSCIVYAIGEERPSIHLDQELIQKIHQLNCEIDIDLYFLPDEVKPNQNGNYNDIINNNINATSSVPPLYESSTVKKCYLSLDQNQLKQAILELFYENKEEFSALLTEIIEDIALAKAIEEGEKTEIFGIN
jgi:hypothetical protein